MTEFPRSAQQTLDDWVERFQFGSPSRRKKCVINGILHYYSYRIPNLVASLVARNAFAKNFQDPVGQKYNLNPKSQKTFDSIFTEMQRATNRKLKNWEVAALIVEQSKLDAADIVTNLKDYVLLDIKLDPNQLCFGLDLKTYIETENTFSVSNVKITLSDYFSRSLETFASRRSENQLVEEIKRTAPVAGSVVINYRFYILTLTMTTKHRVSQLGGDVDEYLPGLVMLAVNENPLTMMPKKSHAELSVIQR
jgi:hypothetical protein